MLTGKDRDQLQETGFSCHSDPHSDICVSTKQLRIDTQNLIIYVSPSKADSETQNKQFIKPYPSKENHLAMKSVHSLEIIQATNSSLLPSCKFHHTVPAIVFSAGGFSGNSFHDFNDIIIPLFLTSRHFRSQVKFVIIDFKPQWVRKYDQLLKGLSGFEIFDPAKDAGVHCFPGGVIGLKYHTNLGVNCSDVPSGYKFDDFRQFLWESYGLNKLRGMVLRPNKKVIVLISRRQTRVFLNEDEMVTMMGELGFEIKVASPNEMKNLDKFSRLVSTCNLMIGAHGAGLAHQVFLPKGAVVIQVVPIGLQWLANMFCGRPSREMGLKYLEYHTELEESSLSKSYNRHDPAIANPSSIFAKGYKTARAVYLDGQNITLNIARFRETLSHALELL